MLFLKLHFKTQKINAITQVSQGILSTIVRQIEMRRYYPKRSMVVLAFLSVKSYCVGLIKYRSVESLKKDKSVTKQD